MVKQIKITGQQISGQIISLCYITSCFCMKIIKYFFVIMARTNNAIKIRDVSGIIETRDKKRGPSRHFFRIGHYSYPINSGSS